MTMNLTLWVTKRRPILNRLYCTQRNISALLLSMVVKLKKPIKSWYPPFWIFCNYPSHLPRVRCGVDYALLLKDKDIKDLFWLFQCDKTIFYIGYCVVWITALDLLNFTFVVCTETYAASQWPLTYWHQIYTRKFAMHGVTRSTAFFG